MTTPYAYRTLNVFTIEGDPFSGNPLCAFEDGRGLSDAQMQAIARQVNLSETTFVLPATLPGATARVRIFTPTFEMPFAGHPTLGTAHVVRELASSQERVDRVALEMKAGVVGVTAKGNRWTLRAVQAPRTKPLESSRAETAAMLGLAESALALPPLAPLWVDTGAEQLVIPLARPEDVRAARPTCELLERHAFSSSRQEAMAYVWSRDGVGEITARFFFVSGGGVVEDPATGSACANLGGWFLATGADLPLDVTVRQGDAVARPSRLGLRVDAERNVFVGGEVAEVGRGTFDL